MKRSLCRNLKATHLPLVCMHKISLIIQKLIFLSRLIGRWSLMVQNIKLDQSLNLH